jgi:hypothetical protein
MNHSFCSSSSWLASHFGFGIPADQIQVVAALHGLSNLLNFEAAAWISHMNTPVVRDNK